MMMADLALARRLEAAEVRNGLECTAAQMQLHPESCPQSVPVCGGYALYVGRYSPLTHAIGMGLEGPVREIELERMEVFFRSRGALVNVDLCPLAHPSLVEFLSLRGYRLTEFNNVLVKSLAGLAPGAPEPKVSAAAPSEARLWAATAGQGFFEHAELTTDELEVGLNIFHMASAACYLARSEDGTAVAAAAMAVRDRLATFFADTTLPAARGHGYHRALIRARLDASIAQGCDLAMASTLPGSTSQRNYESCGFQVAYTRAVMTG